MNKLILSVSSNPGNFGFTIYNHIFRDLNLPYYYQPICIQTNNELYSLFEVFKSVHQIQGISISMPYKQEALKAFPNIIVCSGLPELKSIASVNTLNKSADNQIYSCSTDYSFFAEYESRIRSYNPNIFVYGTGAMGMMAFDFFTNFGYKVTLLGRNDIHDYTFEPYQVKESVFINCTPTKIEDINIPIFNFFGLLDLPVRLHLNLTLPGVSMSGFDCTKIQFKYQFKEYTKIDLSFANIDQYCNEAFK